jgi:hypothetical protein
VFDDNERVGPVDAPERALRARWDAHEPDREPGVEPPTDEGNRGSSSSISVSPATRRAHEELGCSS